MTTEQRITAFMNKVHEWANSQTRIAAERSLQKTLAEDIETLGIDPKAFLQFARAWHKDQVSQVKEEMDHTLDLFELVTGRQESLLVDVDG